VRAYREYMDSLFPDSEHLKVHLIGTCQFLFGGYHFNFLMSLVFLFNLENSCVFFSWLWKPSG
jgi:hypothetical protein